jgi:predicted DNA-binding antitoxin AbrB/MazE fold protein
MTTTLEATYEQGILRLSQPIPLAEGTRVQVTVTTSDPGSAEEALACYEAELGPVEPKRTRIDWTGSRILHTTSPLPGVPPEEVTPERFTADETA